MTKKSPVCTSKQMLNLVSIMVLLLCISCREYVALENPDIIKSDKMGNIYLMKRYDTIIKFDRNNKILFEIEKKKGFGLDYAYPWMFDLSAECV